MAGDVLGLPRADWVILPRADWVILAGLLLVAAWAVWYYHSRDTPEDNDD